MVFFPLPSPPLLSGALVVPPLPAFLYGCEVLLLPPSPLRFPEIPELLDVPDDPLIGVCGIGLFGVAGELPEIGDELPGAGAFPVSGGVGLPDDGLGISGFGPGLTDEDESPDLPVIEPDSLKSLPTLALC